MCECAAAADQAEAKEEEGEGEKEEEEVVTQFEGARALADALSARARFFCVETVDAGSVEKVLLLLLLLLPPLLLLLLGGGDPLGTARYRDGDEFNVVMARGHSDAVTFLVIL